MKEKIVLVLLIAALWSMSVLAQASVATLSLSDVSLSGCGNNTFSGSYRLTARDAQGNVVNESTAVEAVGVFQANGITQSDEYKHTSALTNYGYYFPGQTLVNGTLYFYLKANPGVKSETYLMDCATLTATSLAISGVSAGDDRLNPNTGDLINVLYARTDFMGKPEIQVFTLNSASQGVLRGRFNYFQFSRYLNHPPARTVRLGRIANSTLYALSTGEFQINIGPDAEGKTYSVILDTLPPTQVTLRTTTED